ncbi:MAG: cob(I)yrinic acid a,c-diamide adenosyltransferase [Gammaproteobacteria bacterium]|nr:cob(I)yrinic acid a,c-diamide adenosyltransferase [Gammaproteobacteria bacterium]
MGYRLSKIYTRTGDKGTTGLGDGRRVPKDSPRIEAIGCVDEFNSFLGILIAQGLPDSIREMLNDVQHHLFDLGGELAMPEYIALTADSVSELERQLDEVNVDLPPLKEFILPGGNTQAAHCHYARTLCRRAERRVLQLARQENETVNDQALKYLNRLSDLLFVVARYLARRNGGQEVFWNNPGKERKQD